MRKITFVLFLVFTCVVSWGQFRGFNFGTPKSEVLEGVDDLVYVSERSVVFGATEDAVAVVYAGILVNYKCEIIFTFVPRDGYDEKVLMCGVYLISDTSAFSDLYRLLTKKYGNVVESTEIMGAWLLAAKQVILLGVDSGVVTLLYAPMDWAKGEVDRNEARGMSEL